MYFVADIGLNMAVMQGSCKHHPKKIANGLASLLTFELADLDVATPSQAIRKLKL